jgi:hypothetical protein
MAITKDITKSQIYGKNQAGESFDIVSGVVVAPAGKIKEGEALKITFGAAEYKLSVKQNPSAANKEFSSFVTLASAINALTENNGGKDKLIASERNGRLYISSTLGDKEIKFENLGGSNIVETLALVDVPAKVVAADKFRFSTLRSLRDAIKDSQDATGIEANFIDNSLDVHALVATNGLKIDGQSFGGRKFSVASLGDGTEQGRATVAITSPMHGLKKGDYVYIDGLNLEGRSDAKRYLYSD